MEKFDQKSEQLENYLRDITKERIAVAFSGGVDSTLLLKIACDKAKENGTEVYAFTIHTMLHPHKETSLTKKLASDLGAVHQVISVDELTLAGIENNPENRCYLCKKYMFQKLKDQAEHLNISAILEGTNLDDMKAYRPGIRAVEELGILSPLRSFDFTKEDVRKLAAKYEIEVADRPSMPCMATRFPYGTRLDKKKLADVEQMENGIRELGFYNIRTRIHQNLVRIEVDVKDMEKLLADRQAINQLVKSCGYDYVTIDLEGFRSGSMDINL